MSFLLRLSARNSSQKTKTAQQFHSLSGSQKWLTLQILVNYACASRSATSGYDHNSTHSPKLGTLLAKYLCDVFSSIL